MTLQVKKIETLKTERVCEGNEMLVNIFKKHPHDKVTVSKMISMTR